MTENVPAVRPDAAPAAYNEPPVSAADTDSWIRVVENVAALAVKIAGTEFVPKGMRNSPESVAAAMLYGREVGLPPMTALTQTHVIEGKPSTSAEGMRALVLAGGHSLEVLEASGSLVRMRARRRGSDVWTVLEWTIDQARAAGLAGKDVWKKYPRAMLAARCTDELCGLVFPDVIHGLTVLDPAELEELRNAPPEPTAETTVSREPRKAVTARKRTTRKAAAPKPEPERPEPDAMPLPGEDGYEEPPTGPQSDEEPPPAPEAHPEPETPEKPQDGPQEGDEEAPTPQPITRAQTRMLLARLAELGVDTKDRDERLQLVSDLVGRPINSGNDLTKSDGTWLLDTLKGLDTHEELLRLVDTIATARETGREAVEKIRESDELPLENGDHE
jgi:hypothetical protein